MAERAVARKVDEAATEVRVMVETLAEKEAERAVVAKVVMVRVAVAVVATRPNPLPPRAVWQGEGPRDAAPCGTATP